MSRLSVSGELALDGSGWNRTLEAAEKGVEHLADSMKELGGKIGAAFTVGAIIEASKAAVEYAENVYTASKRLNITTDSVQELGFAAKQAGADLGTVETALDRLAKAKENALGFGGTGGQETANLTQAFSTLGVTIDDIKAKSPEEIFRQIGDQLERMGTNAETTTAMIEIFGRGAGQLIPVLEELRVKSEQAHNIGAVVSNTGIETLHHESQTFGAAKDAGMGTLERMTAGAWALVGPDLANAFIKSGVTHLFNNSSFGKNLRQSEAQGQTADAGVQALNEAHAARMALTTGKPVGPNQLTPQQQKAQDEEIARLDADTARIRDETARKHLSTEERITAEEKKQKELAEALKKAKDPLSRADLQNQIAKNDQALAADRAKHADEALKALKLDETGKALASDSLTKTGNFLGTSSHSMVAIGQQTNDLLRQIVINTSHSHGHAGHGGGTSHGMPTGGF